ncbi:DUF6328 family protein [Frondihabitans australicus]|uniref:Sodium:proton antiporter n=1 Tax=Frondihabitans australicus TaxID=386892 RepID=A0A495IGI1_9MICO|nr:DUF6328 family protein [Frondihabitans australicus]RKR74859.1 hypothetical protein C8E83_1991 [Frondihabitans australicus]
MAEQQHAPDADALPGDGRDETETERLDRNFSEILQELRVTQTGTQILTGFLLAVAFQNRFTSLNEFQVDVYLVLVILAASATALGLAPVSLHRMLFRRGEKDRIVAISSALLDVILICVAACITGVVLLVFDVVASLTAGIVASSCVLIGLLVLWYVFPRRERRSRRKP